MTINLKLGDSLELRADASKKQRKISSGERRFIERELEAFAGAAKPRGCEICRRGADDQKLLAVARGLYTAQKIAEFLIKTRNYPNTFKADAVYKHWYRCNKEK